MQFNTHAISWFEIPVADFDRAKKFYETLFDYQMPDMQMGPARMGILLYDREKNGRGGAIVHNSEMYTPESNGTMVYLNCDPDLSTVIDRVTAAGGSVLVPKSLIAPEMGYWAMIRDTEGNRVGLHSIS